MPAIVSSPAFAASILARMPLAMLTIGMLVHVQRVTGSFAAAGLVSGTLAVAQGAGGPALGRLVDRRGQTAVLLASALVAGAALVAAALLPADAPLPALIALATVIGFATPPVGPCMRALLPGLATDPDEQRGAYAIDSAAVEVTWVSGPPLVLLAGTAVSTGAALVLAGAILTVGTALFAVTRASRAWRPEPAAAEQVSGALRSPGVRTLVLALGSAGLLFGATEVAVTASADALGDTGAAGPLLGLWGVGSLIAGLVVARAGGGVRTGAGLAALLGTLAASHLLLAATTGSLLALGAVIVLAGSMIAPTFASAYAMVDAVAAAGTTTEAFAWLATAIAIGTSAGAAAAGAVADASGPAPAFALAAAAAGVGAAVTCLRAGTLTPRQRRAARTWRSIAAAVCGRSSANVCRRPLVIFSASVASVRARAARARLHVDDVAQGRGADAGDRRVVEQPQQPPVRERQDRARAGPGARGRHQSDILTNRQRVEQLGPQRAPHRRREPGPLPARPGGRGRRVRPVPLRLPRPQQLVGDVDLRHALVPALVTAVGVPGLGQLAVGGGHLVGRGAGRDAEHGEGIHRPPLWPSPDYSRRVAVSPEDQALAAAALVQGLQADAPIAFAVHDEELRFVLISSSLAVVNGRAPDEHLGRTVTEILPPELAGQVATVLAEVRDSGVARTGVEIDGSTHATPGEQRHWIVGYYPVTFEERRFVAAVLVDVTDRKRAQTALRESEAELSGAQRMAGVGWWTWTLGTDAAVYAPELLDLLGRDPARGGRPHSVSKLQLADPGDLDAIREAAMESLATGRPFVYRMRVQHADGRLRVLDARGDVVYDDAGAAVGLQGFSQDVTELARAEQRQRAIAELGQRALEDLDLDVLFQHAVDLVGREVGIDTAGVLEVLPGGERALVRARTGRPPGGPHPAVDIHPGGVVDRALTVGDPVVTPDLLADPELQASEAERGAGARSVAVVVIDGQTRPFGTLGVFSRHPDHFTVEDSGFLVAIANVLADAVERRSAQAAIAEISAARGRLVAQAIDAEDHARRTISEALHDGALQELLAVRNELFGMAGRGGDDAALAATQERLTAVVVRLRDVMSALHPTMLQYGGLEAALLAVVEQERGTGDFEAHVAVEADAAGLRDELLLSLARELIANTARHGGASRVDVGVRLQDGAIVLRVADDGAGFAPGRLEAALEGGAIGVASCRERVEALGGSLLVQAAPGAGTRVVARIPHIPEIYDPERGGISRLDEGQDRA